MCLLHGALLADLINVFEVFLPQLLLYPNPADPLNGEAAALLMREPQLYNQKVKGEWLLNTKTEGHMRFVHHPRLVLAANLSHAFRHTFRASRFAFEHAMHLGQPRLCVKLLRASIQHARQACWCLPMTHEGYIKSVLNVAGNASWIGLAHPALSSCALFRARVHA